MMPGQHFESYKDADTMPWLCPTVLQHPLAGALLAARGLAPLSLEICFSTMTLSMGHYSKWT